MTNEQILKKIEDMEEEYDRKFYLLNRAIMDNTNKLNNIFSIVKGIAIGLAIGALIFGFLTIKDFISIAK